MAEELNTENPKSGITAPDFETAQDWSLVLAAMNIPHKVENPREQWLILVPPEFQKMAEEQIHLYQKETASPETADEESGEHHTPLVSLFVSFFLLYFFHIVTIATGDSFNWIAAGDASSSDILKGEWWRIVTALTLHNDMGHILSNLSLLTVIAGALCSRMGVGLGWLLILLSGMLGNYMNAAAHPQDYHSIGSSTAVFGAIGILGGIQLFGRFRNRNFSALVPFGGALALLAFFGMDSRTDITAHFFGFSWGVLLGVLSTLIFMKIEIPSPLWQRVLTAMILLFILFCWLSAVHWRIEI